MRKAFITDDSQLYIDTLCGILSEDDVLLCSTTKPVEAVERIVLFMPDVIIIDKTMPEKDGLELLAEIKLDGRINYIPRLLISGERLEDVVRDCHDFDDYIDKLEEIKDIRKRVKIYADIGKIRKAARGKLE